MSKPLNYSKVPRGSAMQIHRVAWRIAPHRGPGSPAGDRSLGTEDIPTIRRLLRTDMTLDEIAAQLGTCRLTLQRFVKRRRICNLRARREFISLQKSIAKLPEPA